MKTIRTALLSVFHKDGIDDIARALHAQGVTIYSTGGTQRHIEALDIPVEAVEDLTGYPSILGGRVKTLHPKVFGGILSRRHEDGDVGELDQFEIPEMDLVIVDLYPFEKTVAETDVEQDIIEKIDIGGISLIRAAAKNFRDVLCVSHRDQYGDLLNLLNEKGGATDVADRRRFAAKAFAVSSHYDTAIFHYFERTEELGDFRASHTDSMTLRYGENPHQAARFHGPLDDMFDKLHGKALSYNNLVDIDAAVNVIAEFADEPTFAILKHTNTCGLATRSTLREAYLAALACDTVSAFGGILIANRPIDEATANEIHSLFCEVVIAPDFEPAALEVLQGKKNRILLRQKLFRAQPVQFKTALNGVLSQDHDATAESGDQLRAVTKEQPGAEQMADLAFGVKAVKHLKSNGIALIKNGQLVGMGCGQTSRVDALKQAIDKAGRFGFDLTGAVMASDAFFPFPDCVEIAHEVGITAVVQPGGSKRDQDSIDMCDRNGMAMVFSGVRHFKH